jgi:uncharacterized sporulation protein YeaH/YhbH (DUF444 family)
MTIIIDRRNTRSSKNCSNRTRFIHRYKNYIKKTLDDCVEKKKIKDLTDSVAIPINWDIRDIDMGFNRSTGTYDYIGTGNKEYEKGDRFYKDNDNPESSIYEDEESDQGDYTFTLTKEEFFDLYFDDMELPDFIKTSMMNICKSSYKRAGYIKNGVISRLDILKTLQMSLARRLSCPKDKNPPFLDDIDLRFKNIISVPQPMLKAVMFCMMDVSGSMTEHHSYLSKKFFILLYLFLCKNYTSVDIRFIRYHHSAKDVSEEEFFNSHQTGGTQVLPALQLINEIIKNEYSINTYNIYIAHTSDGDIGNLDDTLIEYLDHNLINKLQYYAYLQVQDAYQYGDFKEGNEGLYGILKSSSYWMTKLNIETAVDLQDIFPVLKNLFKRNK